MSHWTHFITEADIANTATPEQWEVEEAWEAERVALCNADNEAARNDIPVPEGFEEALEEAREQRAQWLEQQKALERLEREARRAELEGLMVCGDDEWARR
jgi:hypothetical protein